MAARARRQAGVAGPALMMVTGLVVLGLGLVQLQRLERTHLAQEILYPVSDQTLLLWLRTQDPAAPQTVALIRDRLLDLVRRHRRSTAGEIREAIQRAVRGFASPSFVYDDFTMIVLKRLA